MGWALGGVVGAVPVAPRGLARRLHEDARRQGCPRAALRDPPRPAGRSDASLPSRCCLLGPLHPSGRVRSGRPGAASGIPVAALWAVPAATETSCGGAGRPVVRARAGSETRAAVLFVVALIAAFPAGAVCSARRAGGGSRDSPCPSVAATFFVSIYPAGGGSALPRIRSAFGGSVALGSRCRAALDGGLGSFQTNLGHNVARSAVYAADGSGRGPVGRKSGLATSWSVDNLDIGRVVPGSSSPRPPLASVNHVGAARIFHVERGTRGHEAVRSLV